MQGYVNKCFHVRLNIKGRGCTLTAVQGLILPWQNAKNPPTEPFPRLMMRGDISSALATP